MNAEAYRQLRKLPQSERLGYLTGLGMSAADAKDLLASLVISTQKLQPKSKPWRISDMEWQEVLNRTQNPELVSKPGPEDLRSEQERKFARDVMLNQFLMGGSTRYDDASLFNPDFKKTKITTWFKEIFQTSYKQAALVIGDKGVGKTWGTLAYMNSITQAKGSLNRIEYADSLFVTAFKLAEWFHASKQNQKALDEVMTKRHLMIDDLGAEPSGFRGSDFIAYFDYLFSERHKFKRHTFITSNATAEQIKALYGDRFVSRFNEIGLVCETGGPDLRIMRE